jgi:hypothetical protein
VFTTLHVGVADFTSAKQVDFYNYAWRSTNMAGPKDCLKNWNQPNLLMKETIRYVGKKKRSCKLNKISHTRNARKQPARWVLVPYRKRFCFNYDLSPIEFCF